MGKRVGSNHRDQLSTVQYLQRTTGIVQSRERSLTLTTHLNASADHTLIEPPQAVQNIALWRDNKRWQWLVHGLVITMLKIHCEKNQIKSNNLWRRLLYMDPQCQIKTINNVQNRMETNYF